MLVKGSHTFHKDVILKNVAIGMQALPMLRGSLTEVVQQKLGSVEGGSRKHCKPHEGILGIT